VAAETPLRADRLARRLGLALYRGSPALESQQPSKYQLHSKLHDARRSGARDHTGCRLIDRMTGNAEVRMIEDVVKLGAELRVEAFGDGRVLIQRESSSACRDRPGCSYDVSQLEQRWQDVGRTIEIVCPGSTPRCSYDPPVLIPAKDRRPGSAAARSSRCSRYRPASS